MTGGSFCNFQTGPMRIKGSTPNVKYSRIVSLYVVQMCTLSRLCGLDSIFFIFFIQWSVVHQQTRCCQHKRDRRRQTHQNKWIKWSKNSCSFPNQETDRQTDQLHWFMTEPCLYRMYTINMDRYLSYQVIDQRKLSSVFFFAVFRLMSLALWYFCCPLLQKKEESWIITKYFGADLEDVFIGTFPKQSI